jgi:transcriptional regulatory protein LevR
MDMGAQMKGAALILFIFNIKKEFDYLLFTGHCDQVCNYIFTLLFPASSRSDFISNNIWQHALDCSFFFPRIQKKRNICRFSEMNQMYLNAAIFSVTSRSISSIKIITHFYLIF